MFLAELAVILVAAKLCGELAARGGQPPVLGQLVAGLILGTASVALLPADALQSAAPQMTDMANLGVILLMFLAGLETDWDQLRACGKAAFSAAASGVMLALLLGFATGLAFGFGRIEALFVGVILMATSVTITAQTLMELGSLQTVEGSTVLGAAVIDDVLGLVVFSMAVAYSGAQQTNVPLLLFALALFLTLSFKPGAALALWLLGRAERMRGSEATLAVALAVALFYGFAAQNAGLAAITGAYLAGLLINRGNAYDQMTEKVKVLAYGLFVPVFLVKTGMDARLENLGPVLGFVGAITLVAIATKIIGCGLGARVAGLSLRQSTVVSVGMIARGEVTLVIASLALNAGVISQLVFTAAVVVVVATALVAPLLLRLALRPSRAAPSSSLAIEVA